MMVMLSGLTTMRDLNGRSGVVVTFDETRGRYEIRMANRIVRAKPSQLHVHPLQLLKLENCARALHGEPNVLWIVVEDTAAPTAAVAALLQSARTATVHLSSPPSVT